LELGRIRPFRCDTELVPNLVQSKPQKGCDVSLYNGLRDLVNRSLYEFAWNLLETQANRRLKLASDEELQGGYY
jgi:hypothetical protein